MKTAPKCAPDEPGELVHRGALVGLGYWNDPERPPSATSRCRWVWADRLAGMQLPEIAVFSGDNVRRDAEGFLYFVGRRDEMMKTSGYRVSPTEVEEVLYATGLVGECVAFGVPNDMLGQSVQVIATPPEDRPWMCRPDGAPARPPADARLHGAAWHRRALRPCRATPTARSTAKTLSTDWLERHPA